MPWITATSRTTRFGTRSTTCRPLLRTWCRFFQRRTNTACPTFGTCGSASEPCRQYVAVVTNNGTLHLEGGERPEVFFSGAVHGNERVGPTATVEFARLLVRNYLNGSNAWLRRLVDTRIVSIMPSANAYGYAHNRRTEGMVDPNRDFPYGNQPDECMKTTAARAINEMYRDHLFQLALTFHSGMKAIAYEWGSPNHPRGRDISPDDGGFRTVGNILHRYASNGYYPNAGPMNTIVYPVTGGMEDWAYAASWDSSYAPTCRPLSFGGYPESKTQYSSDMLRAFNILIETSNIKAPPTNLGASEHVLQGSGSSHDGHVARNLRICLAMADLVRPYLVWTPSPEHLVLPPSMAAAVTVGDTVNLAWDVGGANHVGATGVIRVPWTRDSCPQDLDADVDSPAQRFVATLLGRNAAQENVMGAGQDGTVGPTLWSAANMWDTIPDDADATAAAWSPLTPRYSAQYAFGPTDVGRIVLLAAYAEVDTEWADAGSSSEPAQMPPQAHVVKARTVPGYRAENSGHVIVGHRMWYSVPLCYRVGEAAHPQEAQPTSTVMATKGPRPIVEPSRVNCGPAGYCDAHASCTGACPPPGPCSSTRCVCHDGYEGDGHNCSIIVTTTLPLESTPLRTSSVGLTSATPQSTWDCALSSCIAESGRCALDDECNTVLLGGAGAGQAVVLPPGLSDAALRAAVPLLRCSDQSCGTTLMVAVSARITTGEGTTSDETGMAGDASNAATISMQAAVGLVVTVVAIVLLTAVVIRRRRGAAYAAVLTEDFNPMWSVDDDVATDEEGGYATGVGDDGETVDNMKEYYEWQMRADDAAGMAAAIGATPSP